MGRRAPAGARGLKLRVGVGCRDLGVASPFGLVDCDEAAAAALTPRQHIVAPAVADWIEATRMHETFSGVAYLQSGDGGPHAL